MVEVIAEIGINHDGKLKKALKIINDAFWSGCKTVKFQCHVVEDEYIPLARNIVPANATENIYDMMVRCSFTEEEERHLKEYTESLGMTYLSTPFSRAAADRLERLGVGMYKIGSGECNNYPLIKHIVSKGKPVILSTGMNNLYAVDKAVDIIGDQLFAILHCVSEYPTPYEHVNLNRMLELGERYHVPYGLSDHSLGIYTALAAVSLGASVVEKHFTSDKTWPGADVPISIGPTQLRELVCGVRAIEQALEDNSPNDKGTAAFAFASVVTTKYILAGEKLTSNNIWVKRPGGGIPAAEYDNIIGKCAIINIPVDAQVKWSDIG